MGLLFGLAGIVAGLALIAGVPWWLGHGGHSVFWLLIPAALGTMLDGKFNVKVNLLMTARAENRLPRTIFYTLILPVLIAATLMLIPYWIGRWMA